jgi:exopolysaccharide biosynthesis polyprenyl glycosylphosphotransferase
MTKTGLDKQGIQTDMFFQPSQRRHRRLQLQISERRLLLMLGDIFAVVVSVLVGLRVWSLVGGYAFNLDFVWPKTYLFLGLIGLWLLLASANDLYELRIAASRMQTFRRLLIINAQMFVIYVVVFFVVPPLTLPRLFILYYAVMSVILISLWRFWRPVLLGWASEARRTLLVGTGSAAQTIINTIAEHAHREYEVKGIIGGADNVGQVISSVPVIGTGADLMNFVSRDRVSELIITSTRELDADTFQAVMDAYERGIAVVPMTLLYERITGRVPVEHISDDWPIVLLTMQSGQGTLDFYRVSKRIMDFLLSLVGMIVLIILLPFLALAIWLDSRGSIFYSQERVGLNGHVFRIYKFRSMVEDAEASTGAVFSKRGDPRVTRVGRFMRRTRLDELPQLVNVLRGDMSLIGPRPERPEHVVRLTEKIPFYRTRLIVRPGLSGWAQVRYDYGSNDVDALVKLEYDLYYIRHQSIILDINIILRTIGKALAFKGV